MLMLRSRGGTWGNFLLDVTFIFSGSETPLKKASNALNLFWGITDSGRSFKTLT